MNYYSGYVVRATTVKVMRISLVNHWDAPRAEKSLVRAVCNCGFKIIQEIMTLSGKYSCFSQGGGVTGRNGDFLTDQNL